MDDFYKRIVLAKDPNRMFTINSDEYAEIFTGRIGPEGDQQALVGLRDERSILVIIFTAHGVLWDVERVHIPPLNDEPVIPNKVISTSELQHFLHQKYGFVPGPIQVTSFLVSDDLCHCSVSAFAWHEEQFFLEEDDYSAEERADWREMLTECMEYRSGILDWGNDWYVIGKDGGISK